MKIKYADIEKRYQVLIDLGGLKLPRLIRAAIARNLNLFENEVQIYRRQRDEILRQYAKKDDQGNVITEQMDNGMIKFDIAPENAEELSREFTELDNIEIDLALQKFPASALDICDESDRYDIPTVTQEAALEWIMEE